MNIAIDFDNTWNIAPVTWIRVYDLMSQMNHKFYLVTSRFDTPCNLQEINELVPSEIEVVFCSNRPKMQVVMERGLHIDVWIDDAPTTITEGRKPRSKEQ